MRILVADDCLDVTTVLQLTLESLGYEVRTANTGRHALLGLVGWQPDIAILDIGFQDLSGLEVASGARSMGVTVYMIALSGCGTPGDIKRALDAGFNDFLIKPAGIQGIRNALAKVVPNEKP